MIGLLKAAAAGALGFVLMWGGWHAYVDHQTWHSLLNSIAQQQQQKPAAEK